MSQDDCILSIDRVTNLVVNFPRSNHHSSASAVRSLHHRGIAELERRLAGDRAELELLMAQPLSVYFDAYRTEDYMDGGEDYLTFHGTDYKEINLFALASQLAM